ncbi:hypothetical protein KTF37_05235 [Burkholderia multivorans]|uniref:hypothetical protein n=1 Tax=Burkholderia multivorans TaxID=87883 RepID=UPI00159083F5|nr:hypothetical protein [Burkholderia multivorans]MBU9676245.1 hypothetical protein [Burkholderia multivorans]
MQTTWRTIKLALCAVVVGALSAAATAQTPAPQFVQLSTGLIVQEHSHRLVMTDARHGKLRTLEMPGEIRRALMSSSSVAFPAARSSMIDGHEFIMVVINQSSSDNPTGYCGAGEEGTLYVLRLDGKRAEPVYSTLVQSCLKNIDLFTDSGNQSPYLAIAWTDGERGFRIHWANYAKPESLTRQYRYANGRFIVDSELPN